MTQAIPLSHRHERQLIFILAGINFCHIVDFMVMMPLGPQLMRLLHISTAQFSLLVSAYTFSAGLSGFASAFIVDHIDRRRMMLMLFAGFLLATLACGLATGYHALMIARLFAGACGGIIGATVMALLGDCIPDERRGAATGLVMSAFSLAAVAGVPLALYFATLFSWRTPFILVAGVGTLLWALAFRILPSVPAHQHGGPGIAETLKGVTRVANHWWSFALIAALMLAGFSVIPFISPYMVHNVGLTEAQLPLIYFFGGAATLVSAPLIGRLADRLGKARMVWLTSLISIVPIFLLTHLAPVALPLVLLVSTGFIVFVSGRLIPALALITASSTPALRGRFLSINSAMQQLAASLAAFWPSWVLAADASGRMLNYEWVGYGAIAATVAAMWIAGRIKIIS
jgi:predicted MFS family arabinose efflux permease